MDTPILRTIYSLFLLILKIKVLFTKKERERRRNFFPTNINNQHKQPIIQPIIHPTYPSEYIIGRGIASQLFMSDVLIDVVRGVVAAWTIVYSLILCYVKGGSWTSLLIIEVNFFTTPPLHGCLRCYTKDINVRMFY